MNQNEGNTNGMELTQEEIKFTARWIAYFILEKYGKDAPEELLYDYALNALIVMSLFIALKSAPGPGTPVELSDFSYELVEKLLAQNLPLLLKEEIKSQIQTVRAELSSSSSSSDSPRDKGDQENGK